MANLTDTATWEANIYRIDETDPVQGWDGADIGISNQQGQQLANRTAYLKRLTDYGPRLTGQTTKIVTNPGTQTFPLAAGDLKGGLIEVFTSTGPADLQLPALGSVEDDANALIIIDPGTGFTWHYASTFRNALITAATGETIRDLSKNIDANQTNIQPNTVFAIKKYSAGKWILWKMAMGEQAPPGITSDYAGTAPPVGWLQANGATVATATYPQLFGVIGYAFGGTGANFNLPNRVPASGHIAIIKH